MIVSKKEKAAVHRTEQTKWVTCVPSYLRKGSMYLF